MNDWRDVNGNDYEYLVTNGLIKFEEPTKDGRRFLVKGVDDKEHLIEADVIIKLVKEWQLV